MSGAILSGVRCPPAVACGVQTRPQRRPRRHRAAATVLLVVSVALATRPLAAQRCGPEALRLEQLAVQPLPPHFGIDGALSLADGGYALWSAESALLFMYPDGLRERRVLPPLLHPVGLAADPDGYRFLDRATGVEYRLGADSVPERIGAVPLAPGEELDAARWRDGGWTIGLRDTRARRFLVRRVDGAGVTTLFASAAADSVLLIPRYHLSETGSALLLTRLTAPFEVLRLTAATGTVDTLAVPFGDAALRLALPDTVAQWRALPAVALDCGWVLTLSDLQSDRRLLLRYDTAGGLAKVTPLDAPFGVMAGRPAEGTLLAARRAGELELVWYQWRWVRQDQ